MKYNLLNPQNGSVDFALIPSPPPLYSGVQPRPKCFGNPLTTENVFRQAAKYILSDACGWKYYSC